MRRLAAAAMLAWVNFTLIFTAMSPAASVRSSLPACCRRDGKHLCSLQTRAPDSGPALQAARCPLYPGAHAVSAQAKATGIATFAAVSVAIASQPASRPQMEARYRMSYSRAGQKRGPPAFPA